MKAALTFLGFAIAAWALWRLLGKQEQNDAEFTRRIAADDRRAKSNLEADARDSQRTKIHSSTTDERS